MRGKILGWVLFLTILLLLSLSVTPYSRTASFVLICVRLTVIAVVSILSLRERSRYRHAAQRSEAPVADPGDRLLQRLRRWYYDEPERPSTSIRN